MNLVTPTAKNVNIVVQNLQDEVLIYDMTTHKAFCLNETAAVVYQHCDGQTSFADLRRKSGKNISDDVILLAIDELGRKKLLTDKVELGVSRRDLLKKAAVSAVALPLITMLVAPRAAHAQSAACTADGTPTGETTSIFGDFTCDPEFIAPRCCNGANPDFTDPMIGAGPLGSTAYNCVCGPQIGLPPA